MLIPILFFFSSRRRHTRWPRDWSSDVCSSDLQVVSFDDGLVGQPELPERHFEVGRLRLMRIQEIGRASCRERGETRGAAVAEKENRGRECQKQQYGERERHEVRVGEDDITSEK